MSNREYGWERDEDTARRRSRDPYRGGSRQGAYRDEPYRSRDEWSDEPLEEQAFGGYPDYREDRHARHEQSAWRMRGGRGGEYARERTDPHYGAAYGERYPEQGRGGMQGEPYQGGYRGRYPQEERGDDWADTYRAQAYGGYGGQSGQRYGEEEFEPDYRDWRRRRMEALDDDYRAFRQERQKKFADEFDDYRKNRTRTSGAASTIQAGSADKSSS